jgi:hypothetical protein
MPLDCLQGSEAGYCFANTKSGAGKEVAPLLGLLVAVAGAIVL